MSLQTSHQSKTAIFTAPSRLTIGRGDAKLRDAVSKAIDEGQRTVIIDLGEVRYLDSAGVGEIMAAHRALESLGGQLILARLSPKVGGVLAATHLSGVLEITESLDSALLAAAA